jgi:hypothetical protein
MDQQPPFSPGQKFYFTSEAPMTKPKRGSIVLPLLGAVIAAAVIGMGFATIRDSTIPPTDASKSTPTASPQAVAASPSPVAITAPAILPEQAATPIQAAPASNWNAYAKPSPGDDLVGVYEQPSMQSQLIGFMMPGDAVTVSTRSGEWANIQRGKSLGWVKAQNLEVRQ